MKKICTPEEIKKILTTKMPLVPNLYATSNFSWNELLTKQKEIPNLEVLENLLEIVKLLQYYRAFCFDNSPIIITSGWRSLNYNAAIGGASPRSYHTKGMALDFIVKGFTPINVQKALEGLHIGGLEVSTKKHPRNYTHIDLGTKRIFDSANNMYEIGNWY
jgi:uncharacterized protein YcbK (DUF882 family)